MLNAIIDSAAFEGLDATLQAEYTQVDEGYLLQVGSVNGYSLEDVSGLKSALGKERSTAEKATKTLQGFEGLDAGKARSAMEKVAEMANWTPQDKVAEQIAVREEQLLAKHGKEIETRDGRLTKMSSQINKTLIEGAGATALAKHGANVTLLMPHIKEATKVVEDTNGDFVTVVVDRDGHARISTKQGSQEPMSIAELVEEMKTSETFGSAFPGENASGGGANQNQRRAGSSGAHTLSQEDSRDVAKYRAASAAAKAAGAQLTIEQ